MADDAVFPVPNGFAKDTTLDAAGYADLYARSIKDPDGFWGEMGRRLDWITPYTQVRDVSWDAENLHVRWYHDGVLNVCANCVDRHLETKGDQPAIIWEGDDPSESETITYQDLFEQVCRFANVLKGLGVRKGDRVTIYLPMIPESAYAMLACARIGAIHSVVFAGFSPDALAGRINDCDAKFVITSDEGVRGGRKTPLKQNVDAALGAAPGVEKVLVVRRTGAPVEMAADRDVWWHDVVSGASVDCPPEPMNAEDPLFILYTSGSTGKPKGVLHTTGGYLVWASMTHEYVFDLRKDD
ncbi:MAG: AMP-binding protein, partial [Pseudomonadota bacterium]